ncbi:HAMP domain-containing sensor histidine kinase [Leptotrichia buccalis]|uniref:histidine kinase n=1 Tax=Leptotrichia buccalis (strain ATCC 14201 / DSM 1135 / JCM 12969 / NCTC 10249 / C-1013-b) TaxID=523794 RepID=C7NAZ4_LEPBD|nr:HAMP domain-containing sensor histidine kinase [Leptotrichia buccalis]ACV39325.1 histidine kinase [Leptotrichia buccalis C-1013-b]
MKKIKDKIIIANTVSLIFISFIIILSMTIFLIHTAVETETKEMDKLIPVVIEKLDKVPDNKLKETYEKYDYADKEYISLAVLRNGKFIYLTDDEKSFKLKKFESNKLKTKWDRFIYKKIYNGYKSKYYVIRNFEFMEAHELLYVMLAMFVLITISIIIISKIVAEHVLTPLSNIISQSNEMSKHNIDLQLTKTRDDEIGELIDVLNETFNKKKEIIKSQKAFTSNVSHELKTPLAIMKGYLDILKWGKDDKDLLNEAIENLNLEVKNIERIINTLFLNSNLEKITVKKEITDVKQLFKKIKKDYELLNIKNEMIIKVNNEVNIFVDKNLISEALRGLIDNCIKYSIGNIELIAREDEVVEIIVRNYGEGIPEEEKKNLFNRNFQGKNAKKGLGLGLPIIKDIILLNDGKIYIENRKDGIDVKIQFKKIDYKNE